MRDAPGARDQGLPSPVGSPSCQAALGQQWGGVALRAPCMDTSWNLHEPPPCILFWPESGHRATPRGTGWPDVCLSIRSPCYRRGRGVRGQRADPAPRVHVGFADSAGSPGHGQGLGREACGAGIRASLACSLQVPSHPPHTRQRRGSVGLISESWEERAHLPKPDNQQLVKPALLPGSLTGEIKASRGRAEGGLTEPGLGGDTGRR